MEFTIKNIIAERSLEGITEYEIIASDGIEFSIKLYNQNKVNEKDFEYLVIEKYKKTKKLPKPTKYEIGHKFNIGV